MTSPASTTTLNNFPDLEDTLAVLSLIEDHLIANIVLVSTLYEKTASFEQMCHNAENVLDQARLYVGDLRHLLMPEMPEQMN